LFVIIVNDTLPEITTYRMCVRAQTSALGIANDRINLNREEKGDRIKSGNH